MTDTKRCRECGGVRVQGEHCLAHLTATELDNAAERLRDGEALDARSTELAPETIAKLLDRVRGADGRPSLPAVDFRRARFGAGVDFAGTSFSGHARFDDARFAGKAGFEGTHFADQADFDRVTFPGWTDFRRVRFDGEADFRGVQFQGSSSSFKETEFAGPARFHQAHFSGAVSFERAVFRMRAELGPMTAVEELSFLDTVFDGIASIDVSARVLSCHGARFNGRADLNLRWAEVVLDRATFMEPSALAGVPPFPTSGAFPKLDEEPVREAAKEQRADRGLEAEERPRLLSVRLANVEGLALRSVDLSACHFFGANSLDRLRIEVDCHFAGPPASRRYTRRRTLAEEHDWRATHGPTQRRAGWRPPVCQLPKALAPDGAVEPLEQGEIASVYRSLRKALEDHKDEPGAADFYYGEMEMRRLTKPSETSMQTFAERQILRLYWAVSGYGLRASRAFICLAATILVGAILLDLFGFRPDRAYGRSLLFATESTISLLRAPPADLRAGGEVVQIMLRLLGPLFLGLALLALRGRVKR